MKTRFYITNNVLGLAVVIEDTTVNSLETTIQIL